MADRDAVIRHAQADLASVPGATGRYTALPGGYESRTALEAVGAGFKAFWDEALGPALDKLIPQGAAEITQALFTENPYVPYGPTEKPLTIDTTSHTDGMYMGHQEQNKQVLER